MVATTLQIRAAARPPPHGRIREEQAPFDFVLSSRNRADAKAKPGAVFTGSPLRCGAGAGERRCVRLLLCSRKSGRFPFFGTRAEMFFCKCTSSESRRLPATLKNFPADDFVRPPTTLSSSKGEDYEDVEIVLLMAVIALGVAGTAKPTQAGCCPSADCCASCSGC
jgi:hypothetical protein